tara:strand:- start:299 stop:1492 length:1194 start_codon:yes stop_codon:yes gene_type:complete
MSDDVSGRFNPNDLVMSKDAVNAQSESVDSRRVQILNEIKTLDKQEEDLYGNLEDLASQINVIKSQAENADSNVKAQLKVSMTTLEQVQNDVLTQLKNLGENRSALYKQLGNAYVDLQTTVSETRADLVNQKTLSDVMSSELVNIQTKADNLEEAKHNQMRLVEINTYYGKRYKAHAQLMKILAFSCVPFLVIAILFRYNMISKKIRAWGVIISLVVAIVLVFRKLLDISSRDNMNYDEYNFRDGASKDRIVSYNKKHMGEFFPKGTKEYLEKKLEKSLGLGCIGAQCCETHGIKYDKKKKRCVLPNGEAIGPLHQTGGPKDATMDDASKDGFSNINLLNPAPVPRMPKPAPTYAFTGGSSLSSKATNKAAVICNMDTLQNNMCGGDNVDIISFEGF